jgi:hypothetical protein
LHYEFKILDPLVISKLNPSFVFSLSDDELEECASLALTEVSTIQNKLFNAVFELKESHLIEIYICRHQKQLIFLADSLNAYLLSKEQLSDIQQTVSISVIKLWESVYQLIEDLLTFIETHFSKYLDPDKKIPERLKIDFANQCNEYLSYIEQFKNSETEELIQIATYPVLEFIDNQKTITYCQFTYLKELTLQYFGFKKQAKETDYAIYLIKRLFYINFNTLPFLQYLTAEIQQVLNSIENEKDKIEKLSWFHKIASQTHINPDLVFNPKSNSIKVLILQYIEDEISHKSQLTTTANHSESILIESLGIKLETDLSVDQYAFFIRVVFESGLYKNISKLKLADFFSQNTNTKMTEGVSAKNFRNKMYEADVRDQEVVKSYIIKMLSYIQNFKIIIFLLYAFRVCNSLILSKILLIT